MKVLATWEFDADVDDLNGAFVDIPGTAVALAKCEMEYMIDNDELTCDDFDFQVNEPVAEMYEDETPHDYNPVERAYQSLVNVFHTKKKPLKANLELAIEEAIGYLGEALK